MSKVNDNDPIVRKDLNDAVDSILGGMQMMFDKQDKRFEGIDKEINNIKADLNGVKADITVIKNDIRWMKDDINGIKADLSDTPSKKEFNQLKTKVNDYISAN